MHLANIKTICYSNSTWKQKAWAWFTGKAQQNMNTGLSPEIIWTCSKGHGKIANNNRFIDLAELLDMTEIASGSNVQSTKSTCYRNLTWQNKICHESTKCIQQKYLTDNKPKRTRRYDGTHVNIASFVNSFQTWQKTEHGSKQNYEGILVSLIHSSQGNAWQNKHTYSKVACL